MVCRHTLFTLVTPVVKIHPVFKAIVSDFHKIFIQSFDNPDVSSIYECEELLAIQNRRQWPGVQLHRAPELVFHFFLHLFGATLEVCPIVSEPRREGGGHLFSQPAPQAPLAG